jgi:hypothetical protein
VVLDAPVAVSVRHNSDGLGLLGTNAQALVAQRRQAAECEGRGSSAGPVPRGCCGGYYKCSLAANRQPRLAVGE